VPHRRGHPRVKIWPSNRTLIIWWWLIVPGIVGLRWQKTLASEESPREMVRTVVADWSHLFGLLLVGVTTIVALRAAGWFIALGDATESNSLREEELGRDTPRMALHQTGRKKGPPIEKKPASDKC
jgi:hypothetical protein